MSVSKGGRRSSQARGILCPRCRKRPCELKGLDPKMGLPVYRPHCAGCGRVERLKAGYRDEPPPICPKCRTRPRAGKGFRRGKRRYRALCDPCARARFESQRGKR